jgi:hypothetical protein
MRDPMDQQRTCPQPSIRNVYVYELEAVKKKDITHTDHGIICFHRTMNAVGTKNRKRPELIGRKETIPKRIIITENRVR